MRYRTPIFAVLCGTLLIAPVKGALLLHYTFDSNDATNSGTLGDGAAFGGVTYAASGADGGTFAGNAAVFDRAGANTAGIDTNLTASVLGFAGTSGYTAMAWVLFNGTGQDNMVFGQDVNGAPGFAPDINQLHHGIRNDGNPLTANQHSGHWGNDITDQGTAVPLGTWTHLAYTYDGVTLTQYLNGAENGSAAVGALAAGANNFDVTIGHTDRNGQGSFDGSIDEVKVYDEVLDAAGIQAASQIIPEPSMLWLIGLSGTALIFRRRRRQTC